MIYAFEIKPGDKIGPKLKERDSVIGFHGHYETRGEAVRLVGNKLMKAEGHIGKWRHRLSNCRFVTKEEGVAMGWNNAIGYPEPKEQT